MERYFVIGPVAGTPFHRYAVLENNAVVAVFISRPDGSEVDRPTHVRWRLPGPAEVKIKQYRINETTPVPHNGEQPRKATWSRAGRRAVSQ